MSASNLFVLGLLLLTANLSFSALFAPGRPGGGFAGTLAGLCKLVLIAAVTVGAWAAVLYQGGAAPTFEETFLRSAACFVFAGGEDGGLAAPWGEMKLFIALNGLLFVPVALMSWISGGASELLKPRRVLDLAPEEVQPFEPAKVEEPVVQPSVQPQKLPPQMPPLPTKRLAAREDAAAAPSHSVAAAPLAPSVPATQQMAAPNPKPVSKLKVSQSEVPASALHKAVSAPEAQPAPSPAATSTTAVAPAFTAAEPTPAPASAVPLSEPLAAGGSSTSPVSSTPSAQFPQSVQSTLAPSAQPEVKPFGFRAKIPQVRKPGVPLSPEEELAEQMKPVGPTPPPIRFQWRGPDTE